MTPINDKNQAGVILMVVLLTLTLLGIVGLSFTFYASQSACSQNPTVDIRDGKCIKDVGPDRR